MSKKKHKGVTLGGVVRPVQYTEAEKEAAWSIYLDIVCTRMQRSSDELKYMDNRTMYWDIAGLHTDILWALKGAGPGSQNLASFVITFLSTIIGPFLDNWEGMPPPRNSRENLDMGHKTGFEQGSADMFARDIDKVKLSILEFAKKLEEICESHEFTTL